MKNRLKSYRHKLEMNQKQFAELLGVTQSQVSLWERQKIQPDLETAFKLAEKLNILVDDLFEMLP